jgi:hypothetical protein
MSFWRGELIRVLARVKALEDQADPVLVALAELDATAGLIEQTGAATFAKRPLSATIRMPRRSSRRLAFPPLSRRCSMIRMLPPPEERWAPMTLQT